MKLTRINICDSVSLTAIKTDKFKTGMISFSLSLPMKREISAYNMLLCGVLQRGCSSFPSIAEINKHLDELYASTIDATCSRIAHNDMLTFTAEMIDNAFVKDNTDILDGVVHTVSELLLHPVLENGIFPEKTVSKEKITVQDSLRSAVNNPKLYAHIRCSELLRYGNKEFPTIDEIFNIISSINTESLSDHYNKLIDNASLNVFYIGSENTERVASLIKTHFSKFRGKANIPNSVLPEKFTELKEITEDFMASQGKLCMGFRSGVVCSDSEKYFATVLFNEIFGGSPASKLFMNVRETLGLCYYCSSSYDAYSGNITVSSGINVDTVEQTKLEILNQLEDIKNGNITDAELNAAKLSIYHCYRQIYDYPSDLFSFYSLRGMLGIEASPEEYLEKFEAVTREQIIEIAKDVTLDTVFFLRGILDEQEEDEEDSE